MRCPRILAKRSGVEFFLDPKARFARTHEVKLAIWQRDFLTLPRKVIVSVVYC